MDQRQRWLAFSQVVADVLPDVCGHARIVERIVDQLKGGADPASEFGRRFFDFRAGIGQDRAEPCCRFKEAGGLVADDLQIARLINIRIIAVHELQYFALGNDVGGIAQDPHDRHSVDLDHHLEGTRIKEVAHQHRGSVAEAGVGGLTTAAQRRFVDHIVMQKRCGVDEFDHRGQQDMVGFATTRFAIAKPARKEQHQDRSQAFAAGADDVAADGIDQFDLGAQPLADGSIDLEQVGGNIFWQ